MSQLNSTSPGLGCGGGARQRTMAKVHMRDLPAADPKRWQNFHVEHDTWLLDISRQRITRQTLPLLV